MGNRTVLFILHRLGYVGPSTTILRLIGNIDRSQVTPIVLAPDNGPLTAEFEKLRVEVVCWPKRERFFRKLDIARIYSLILSRGVDLVHINTKVIPLAAFAAGISPAKTIWHLHEIFKERPYSNWRLASRVTDYFLFNSHSSCQSLRKFLSLPRYQIIHNGVEVPPDPVRAPERNEIKILMVSNIQPQKGQDHLLSAFIRLSRQYPHLTLHFVGDCFSEWRFYLDAMQKRVLESGVNGRVVFHGFMSDPTPLVDDADVIAHTSLEESFGNVIAEGMARGKPAVVFAVGGVGEIVRDGENGFLVEKEDENALIERLSILIRDRELREKLGENAHRRIKDHFSAELMGERYMKLCREIFND